MIDYLWFLQLFYVKKLYDSFNKTFFLEIARHNCAKLFHVFEGYFSSMSFFSESSCIDAFRQFFPEIYIIYHSIAR